MPAEQLGEAFAPHATTSQRFMSGGSNSGLPTEPGGEMQSTFFHESNDSNGVVLDLVVIHRVAVPPPRHGILRSLFSMLRLVCDTVTGNWESATSYPDPHGEWGSCSGCGGRFEVRFNAKRRRVRAAGREIPLPDAGTLVVLVDMVEVADARTEVVTTVVDTRAGPHDMFARGNGTRRERAARRRRVDETLAAWRQAVDSDPVVRAFRARPGLAAERPA